MVILAASVIAALYLFAPGASAGSAGYNSIPSTLPGNVFSQGFECCTVNEFGDSVGLGKSGATLQSISVVMSSWACESGHWYDGTCTTTPGTYFTVPITITVYALNAGPDTLYGTSD